jgi:hypothetical protein
LIQKFPGLFLTIEPTTRHIVILDIDRNSIGQVTGFVCERRYAGGEL